MNSREISYKKHYKGRPLLRTLGSIPSTTKTNNREEKCLFNMFLRKTGARYQWLTPVILVTQETDIRRIKIQSQRGQIVLKALS
jgi:hypothetical protein